MAVERYGSKTDVVVKLVLVFFISLLSFSIGTFVGKKFSDNQHKLSQMEPDAESTADRAVASVPGHSTDVKPSEPLSDDEIAKLAEEFVTDDEAPSADAHVPKLQLNDKNADHHTEAKAEPATGRNPASSKKEEAHDAHAATPAADHSEVSKAADNVASGKKPAEGMKVQLKKDSQPATALPTEVASSAAGKFTVQIASYPKEDEATNMANDLKSKGFSAFYLTANVKGQKWYRVSVGMFTTQKEAQAYRDDLLARAKVSSAIVQKIPN